MSSAFDRSVCFSLPDNYDSLSDSIDEDDFSSDSYSSVSNEDDQSPTGTDRYEDQGELGRARGRDTFNKPGVYFLRM